MYKISWGKRAFRIFVKQWSWESSNVGLQAAETMRINVANTLKQIKQMPTIGRLCKQSGTKFYRVIQTHPKSALYYWQNEKEIRIIRFVISVRNQ